MRIENRMSDFEDRLINMSNITYNAMVLAMEAFENEDKKLALEVVEGDKIINYTEEVLNDQAIEILSLMQPVAKDLRLLVGGIKIINDLERIGDYAKNIGRFVLNANTVDVEFKQEILNLATTFLNNFQEIIKLLKIRNVKTAYEVAKLDDKLDMLFDKFIEHLAEKDFEDNKQAVELTNLARNLERAGDHGKNICEQIIYIDKGRYIDFG